MQRDIVPSNGTATSAEAPASALDRALAILELLATHGPASAGEVASALGVSRSATYRLVSRLEERGYIEAAADSRLRLGMRAAEIGMAAVAEIDVARIAPPHLQHLVQGSGETAFLAVVDGHDVVYLHKEPGPHAVQLSAQMGARRPLHCTGLGKAFLSALPEEQRAALVAKLDLRPLTSNTITEVQRLLNELEATARRGYAIDDIEGEEGVACFAAPVLDHRGLPVAAISVAGPAERVLPTRDTSGPLVAEAAAAISRRLGSSGSGTGAKRFSA